MSQPADTLKLLDDIVRRERGWLVSSLVSRLGPKHLDLAEDVAQDAILKALATWPYKGIPENPKAWLRRVAGNKAIDRLRRTSRELGLEDNWDPTVGDDTIITPSLSDPELDLMVLCCDPAIAPQDQLYLALKTVCGFTASETAALFFMKEDALSQRLARAKRKLQVQPGELAKYPTRFALKERLPRLLKIIYLMFAWGYAPRRGSALLLIDLCHEALRLSNALLTKTHGEASGHHALHSLMLFQLARFPARLNDSGELLTLEEQDRTLWERDTIELAMKHLEHAQRAPALTRYHVEAGIAAVHAGASNWSETDWSSLQNLYEMLVDQIPSLSVKISLSVCLMHNGDLSRARDTLDAASEIKGAGTYTGFYLAKAQLALLTNQQSEAQAAFEQARRCPVSRPVAAHIDQELTEITIVSSVKR
ncbi:MAG: DUF6596 domain-containing protein [Pseudomonadota bacterium]